MDTYTQEDLEIVSDYFDELKSHMDGEMFIDPTLYDDDTLDSTEVYDMVDMAADVADWVNATSDVMDEAVEGLVDKVYKYLLKFEKDGNGEYLSEAVIPAYLLAQDFKVITV